MRDDETREDFKDPTDHKTSIFILLGIIFLPGLIIGVAQFSIMLKHLKQRVSMIALVSFLLSSIALIYFNLSDAFNRFVYAIQNITQIQDNIGEIIPFGIVANLIVGSILGFILSFDRVQKMKSNPELVHIKGNWMYDFKFARTPFEVLSKKKLITDLKSGNLADDDKSPLGMSQEYKWRDAPIYRYMEEANRGTVITGGTGSGKTITLTSMILADIMAQRSIVVVDFKSSPELAARLAEYAKDVHGDEDHFYHFIAGKPENYYIPNSKGQRYYDPLVSGGASKSDMLLDMREYDSSAAVYKAAMRQLLQGMFNGLDNIKQGSVKDIVWNEGEIVKLYSALSASNVEKIGNALGHDVDLQDDLRAMGAELDKKGPITQALGELRGQLRTMTTSGYGPWLRVKDQNSAINLYELTKQKGNVILFSIDADGSPDFSQFFGSLIMSDLAQVSKNRRANGDKNQICIYIDEFQAVPPHTIAPLLEKARASEIAMTIASQSFEQVISSAESNGESQLNTILDACSNFFIHAGSSQKAAQRVSEIVGQEKVTRYHQSNTSKSGLFSINFFNKQNSNVRKSEEDDWKVPPARMMGLSLPSPSNDFKATAIIIKKMSADPRHEGILGAVAEECWMIPNSRVLDPIDLSEKQKKEMSQGATQSAAEVMQSEYLGSPDNDEYIYSDQDTQDHEEYYESYAPSSFQTDPMKTMDEEEEGSENDFEFSRIGEGEVVEEGFTKESESSEQKRLSIREQEKSQPIKMRSSRPVISADVRENRREDKRILEKKKTAKEIPMDLPSSVSSESPSEVREKLATSKNERKTVAIRNRRTNPLSKKGSKPTKKTQLSSNMSKIRQYEDLPDDDDLPEI